MSFDPNPPGRSLVKNSRWPSCERCGAASMPALLIVSSRLTGGPHAQSGSSMSVHARRDTHRSFDPNPPGRVEEKYKLRPSFEISGVMSANGELTVGPRLTGADQVE